MDAQIYYVFQNYLTNNPFPLQMDLKWPLSGGSQLKLHLHERWRENRGYNQSFHVASFSKDFRLITSKHEVFNKRQMHDNAEMTKTIPQNYDQKVPGYINKTSPFTKIKLKWPLLGDSNFNIYFHSERRGNRGSNQDFHEILLLKDGSLINPLTCFHKKNQTIYVQIWVSKHNYEN